MIGQGGRLAGGDLALDMVNPCAFDGQALGKWVVRTFAFARPVLYTIFRCFGLSLVYTRIRRPLGQVLPLVGESGLGYVQRIGMVSYRSEAGQFVEFAAFRLLMIIPLYHSPGDQCRKT